MLEFIQIALRAIVSNKLRSSLTLLGVVIGVWAITSMQGVVKGFDHAMQEQLSALGSESFVIQKFPAVMIGQRWWRYARRKDFSYEDALYLQATSPSVQAATAVIERRIQTIKYKDKKTAPDVRVIGTMAEYLTTESVDLASGRFITDDDVTHSRQVAVLGRDVAAELFPYRDPIDQRILVGNQGFVVAGVLDQAAVTFGESPDEIVIIPITAYQKVFTSSQRGMSTTALIVRAWDAQSVDQAADEVVALLRVRRKVPLGEENDFELITAESLMGTMMTFTGYIRIAAIGIAAISLLVAGIGIMNIMLVSVMERTREIGTRKAVGATRRDIRVQFLIEAVLLSELGAAVGIVLAVLTAAGLSPVLHMAVRVPLWAMVAAVGYCSVIGIFFGLFPANKASKLDPIEALRYE